MVIAGRELTKEVSIRRDEQRSSKKHRISGWRRRKPSDKTEMSGASDLCGDKERGRAQRFRKTPCISPTLPGALFKPFSGGRVDN
jgi:hypothetical protein